MPEFILSDARTFKLPPTFNAAFSTFDALNHVMTLEELQQAFKNVNQCLDKRRDFYLRPDYKNTLREQI